MAWANWSLIPDSIARQVFRVEHESLQQTRPDGSDQTADIIQHNRTKNPRIWRKHCSKHLKRPTFLVTISLWFDSLVICFVLFVSRNISHSLCRVDNDLLKCLHGMQSDTIRIKIQPPLHPATWDVTSSVPHFPPSIYLFSLNKTLEIRKKKSLRCDILQWIKSCNYDWRGDMIIARFVRISARDLSMEAW